MTHELLQMLGEDLRKQVDQYVELRRQRAATRAELKQIGQKVRMIIKLVEKRLP